MGFIVNEANPSLNAASNFDEKGYLTQIVEALQNSSGVARKTALGPIVDDHLPDPTKLSPSGLITAWKGEDSAALSLQRIFELAAENRPFVDDKAVKSSGSEAANAQVTTDGTGLGQLLIAADGIRPDLLAHDPYWAGFCSVIVNVNDILAMGGRPLGLVHVLAFDDQQQGEAILKGVADAARKYQVPILGGHTHPPTQTGSSLDLEKEEASAHPGAKIDDHGKEGGAQKGLAQLSTTILGLTSSGILRSDGARPDDELVIAIDLQGKFKEISHDEDYLKETNPEKADEPMAGHAKPSPSGGGAFDTIEECSPSRLRHLCELLPKIAEKKLATACKDISNPGIVGTLGMLCESSGVGVSVDLAGIPVPEGVPLPWQEGGPSSTNQSDRSFIDWLLAYPGYGFLFATSQYKAGELVRMFQEEGVAAGQCGLFEDTGKLAIRLNQVERTVWDFPHGDIITGLGRF